MLRKFIAFAILLLVVVSCTEEEVVDYGPIDKKIIEDYLAAHNLTAQSTASGLYYIIRQPGTEKHPTSKSSVSANYNGFLTNGTRFDSSYPKGKPADLPLPNMILGWQEGVPLIGVGGKIQLFIPSQLAYGSSGSITVPANSVIIFEIELVDFY